MPKPLLRTLGNSTESNELQTSAPESGSEISDMVSINELGIEVESLAHETQPPSSQKPNFKRYEKEETFEPCAPTEDAGQDDVILSEEVGIISKEQFVSNIAQTIPRLEKIQNDSKLPDCVHQKIAEAMSLLKMDLNTAKDARDQGDDMINVEVDHIDNEPPHTESPPILNETIHDETPPPSPRDRETIKNDTMGQDMTDIMPDPVPKVSSLANFQGIFLSHIEEFG
ncbi:hypothetical protein O181_009440 [Austropuccinia psidii MF-1]|uniref:Uncharacterized protein n=1 Tax=Austropuccinia psidii MF-1 TaxID=1389203 RepID=A0A9Q3BRY6_9BASI|nr:hypothetical protein [Austropuccinia psidii MF-1]